MVVVVFGSTLRASGVMPSGPAAFPFFSRFSARSISALDGGLTLTLSRGPSLAVMSAFLWDVIYSECTGNVPPILLFVTVL